MTTPPGSGPDESASGNAASSNTPGSTPPGDTPPGNAAPDNTAEPATKAPPPRRRWKLKLFLLGLLLLPVLFVGFYTVIMLNYAYSTGNQSGQLLTFSHRGWLCKTWEGELAIPVPGMAPTRWAFSVRDDDVARQLIDAPGRRVVLFYEEHRGLPTRCFGATNFFVDSVVVDSAGMP